MARQRPPRHPASLDLRGEPVAQPTETERRFEVSERSSALPVPALSRYARPRSQSRQADTPDSPSEENTHAAAGTVEATAEADVPDIIDEMSLDEAPGRLADLIDVDRLHTESPIVQSPHEAWATDPNPPQPVRDARLPALRDSPPGQKRGDEEPGRRKPFWKRLSSMAAARPAAQAHPSMRSSWRG